jgi:peptide methionine sulfoxide reductase msrA/msrB
MPRVFVFDRSGKLVGPVETAKLELSEDEWQKRLTPEQFRVLRTQGTERAFCGTLLDNKKKGVYRCAGCGLPLFSSDAKFNSGTGWPSFFQPIARENVLERRDTSHGMVRTEINCARCDGHLGHVFDDGPPPTGLRYCLNSESLLFTPSEEVAKLADPVAESAPVAPFPPLGGEAGVVTAVFAGGCFWCTEAVFQELEGVLDVTSGYTGGSKETANYRRVCQGDTGHAESIRITYDPRRITYDKLLDVFFDAHDPTQLDRQGNDVGTQYRSAIFYAGDDERRAAEAKIASLTAKGAFHRPIATTLEPFAEFFPAEQYHQDYVQKHPDEPYIQSQAVPKVCKVREKHREVVRRSK